MTEARLANKSIGNIKPMKGINLKLSGAALPTKAPAMVTPAKILVSTMFDEVKPDLILMDIKMPNLDGLEATKIIRELSATVPIIAQSAFAYEQDRKAAKEAGCNDFIAKPIADDKLKAMIHKWLSPP